MQKHEIKMVVCWESFKMTLWHHLWDVNSSGTCFGKLKVHRFMSALSGLKIDLDTATKWLRKYRFQNDIFQIFQNVEGAAGQTGLQSLARIKVHN